MNEDQNRSETLSETLCRFFGEAGGLPCVPETWRNGAACLRLTGSAYPVREYVDGSAVNAVPFEVRLRCEGGDVSQKLAVLAWFDGLADYVKNHAPADGIRVRTASGASKSAVYDDGSEEYRMALTAELRIPA